MAFEHRYPLYMEKVTVFLLWGEISHWINEFRNALDTNPAILPLVEFKGGLFECTAFGR